MPARVSKRVIKPEVHAQNAWRTLERMIPENYIDVPRPSTEVRDASGKAAWDTYKEAVVSGAEAWLNYDDEIPAALAKKGP